MRSTADARRSLWLAGDSLVVNRRARYERTLASPRRSASCRCRSRSRWNIKRSPLPATSSRGVVADSATSEEQIEKARLLTSAVVLRAMRRAEPDAGGSIGLVVDVSSDRLRVEVTDQSPQLGPSPQGEPSEKEGGWGLIFVAELSDSWGAEPDSVWFELSLEPDGRRSVCARARKGRSPGRHRRQEIRGGQSLTAMAFRCDDCVEWTDYVALPTSLRAGSCA